MKTFPLRDSRGSNIGSINISNVMVEMINELGAEFTFSVKRGPLGLRGFALVFTPASPRVSHHNVFEDSNE